MTSKKYVIEELLNICTVNQLKQWDQIDWVGNHCTCPDCATERTKPSTKQELIDSLIRKMKLPDFEVPHLKELCRAWKLVGYSSMRKDQLQKILCDEAKRSVSHHIISTATHKR